MDVLGTQPRAESLQTLWIGGVQEAVVEALEREALATHLLLDPFMAVEAELDGVGQIRTDLDEGRSPVGVLKVEIVMVDEDALAGEVKHAGSPAVSPGGFERGGLFLGDTDEDDPLPGLVAVAVLPRDVVLALSPLEGHHGNPLAFGDPTNRVDELIMQGLEQGGGRNRFA